MFSVDTYEFKTFRAIARYRQKIQSDECSLIEVSEIRST